MEIDGAGIAEEIINKLKENEPPDKILAAILVGNDPQSESFLKQKQQTAERLGVDFRIYKLAPELKNDGLRREVGRISKQSRVGGVIVQLPMPAGVTRRYVLNAVPKEKDTDVLSERSSGGLLQPAVETVKEIIEREKVDLKNSTVAVVGAGILVGKPISKWLAGKCKDVYLIDSKSDPEKIKDADIVISGVGKIGLIDPKILKKGAAVIDFGYSHNGKLVGDLKMDDGSALNKLRFFTPTPGGTGPILVAKLFENFYKLCAQR